MRISDLISMCLKNLSRSKMRTLLTVTGVVVGTCAIIVMISIGIGMQQAQDAMLADMGDLTIINIYNYGGGNDQQEVKLNDKAMDEILAMPGVVTGTPFYQNHNLSLRMLAGKNNRYEMYLYDLVGVYPQALPLLGYALQDGPGFSESEPYALIYGSQVAYDFRDTKKRAGFDTIYPYPDANGNIKDPYVDFTKDKVTIKMESNRDSSKDKTYKVAYGGTMVENYDLSYRTAWSTFIDIKAYKQLITDYNKLNGITKTDEVTYNNAIIKCTDIDAVDKVESAIKEMGFETNSLSSIRKPMQESVKKQQIFLGGLAGISLFVAAIGITNTMIMSIYERTREIGVMKVLGCFVENIRTIFLMEAACIGFMGGVIGVILSFGISYLMNFFGFSAGSSNDYMMSSQSVYSVIPAWLVIFGLVFATFVGVAAGYYPANRAVKISALEAIKHD